MLHNYMIVALRTLWRNRLYTIINIIGLALGMSCACLIYTYVQYERNFDSFHSQVDRSYRVVEHSLKADGVQHWNTTAYPLAEALRSEFPELHVTQTAGPVSRTIHSQDEVGNLRRFEQTNILFADEHYLQLFDFKGTYKNLWLAGNPKTALRNPSSVVLTQKLAERYFPSQMLRSESILGKTLTLNNKDVLTVTGVIRNPPANTNLLFEMLIPYAFFKQNNPYPAQNWSGNYQGTTYVQLRAGDDPLALERRIARMKAKYMNAEDQRRISYHLQPVSEIHTETLYGSSPESYSVNKQTLWTMTGIGVFLIAIACFNFINLATAQAMKRSREVGIRKVMGSSRLQLFWQFMGETLGITLIALFLSLLSSYYLLRVLNQYLSLIHLNLTFTVDLLRFAAPLTLLVTLLAGFYPAVILSGFQPIQALKNSIFFRSKSGLSLRQGLIVFQFGIACFLIIGTLVMARQMNYFLTKDLGFVKEAIVTVNIPNQDSRKAEVLRQRWLQQPTVQGVSYASGAPTTTNRQYGTDFRLSHEPVAMMRQAEMKVTDLNYKDLYGLQLIAGRWLSQSNVIPEGFNGFVANESLVKQLNLKPEEAVGKRLIINEGSAEIIGVVKDFHNNSLQESITPCLMFYWGAGFMDAASIRLQSTGGKIAHLPETMAFVEKTWKEMFPDAVFQLEFLDNYLLQNYVIEILFQNAFQLFAIIAIFISCLGLFGLATFTITQRTKEIGIRKVLGASTSGIVALLSKDFLKLVLIAFVIATPIAWYAMNQWLQDFAYKIDIPWWIFVLAGLLAIAIALFTVSFQAVKAALANPVKSLRSE